MLVSTSFKIGATILSGTIVTLEILYWKTHNIFEHAGDRYHWDERTFGQTKCLSQREIRKRLGSRLQIETTLSLGCTIFLVHHCSRIVTLSSRNLQKIESLDYFDLAAECTSFSWCTAINWLLFDQSIGYSVHPEPWCVKNVWRRELWCEPESASWLKWKNVRKIYPTFSRLSSGSSWLSVSYAYLPLLSRHQPLCESRLRLIRN